MTVKIFFLLLATISSGYAFLGPCTVFQMGPPTEGGRYEEQVDASCMNGTIEWHYPQGELYITFEPSRPSSSVCLWHGIGPTVQAVYKMTFSGPERITDPTQNQDSCVDFKDGKVVIKFDDPPFLTYMTSYAYRIIE